MKARPLLPEGFTSGSAAASVAVGLLLFSVARPAPRVARLPQQP